MIQSCANTLLLGESGLSDHPHVAVFPTCSSGRLRACRDETPPVVQSCFLARRASMPSYYYRYWKSGVGTRPDSTVIGDAARLSSVAIRRGWLGAPHLSSPYYSRSSVPGPAPVQHPRHARTLRSSDLPPAERCCNRFRPLFRFVNC